LDTSDQRKKSLFALTHNPSLVVGICMRDVMIFLEKNQFQSGEEVAGHIVVKTDSFFSCNRVILKVKGQEYTHYQAGKVHVSETHPLIEDVITVWEGGEIHAGDTKFEFRFDLPENLPPNYEGLFGTIDYSIEAVVELDRALDPKEKVPFEILASPPKYIPEPMDRLPIRKVEEHIEAEIPTDIIRPGKGLVIRFLVRERSRIKGVRLDIVRKEDATCQKRELDYRRELNQKRIPITFNDFGRWIDESIHEDWLAYPPFEGKLIKSSLHLKVVLEVGLSLDPEIWFPLQLSGEGEKDEDLFEAIEMDLGWD